MSNASQRAFEQMRREGIAKIRTWGKPFRHGGFSFQEKLERPFCDCAGCKKRASYTTPRGNRCFTHARGEA